MARLALALALLVFGAVIVAAESSIPLFLWSGSQIFIGGHNVDARVQSPSSLDSLFSALLSAGENPALLSSQSPEVVVALVTPTLGTGASSASELSNLQSTVADARSSLSLPYSRAISAALSPALATAPGAQTIRAKLGHEDDACESLLSRLAGDKFASIYRNGKTDAIVIKAQSVAAADACVSRVSDLVNQLTAGQFVALFSAEAADVHVATEFPSPRQSVPLFSTMAAFRPLAVPPLPPFTNTTIYYGPQYITANILIGLLCALLVIVTALCGVSCLMNIKPPLRFATQRLNVGREY